MNDDISTIFISAGEPSGDIHAAELVLSLKNLSPKINFIGNGGDKMIEAGVNVNNHISSMSVMGFIDVVKHLPKLQNILNNTISAIKLSKPDKIILIDYPGFNLRLVKKIKNLNIPITYFILPQTWAWKENRNKFMKDTISDFISIFPFEASWYNSKGLTTYYPGHPFIEKSYDSKNRKEFFKKHSLNENEPLLILLPGSRQQEIENHWPIFLKTVFLIIKKNPSTQFLVVKSSNINLREIPDFIKVEKSTTSALTYGTAAISSSGTVTLECALAKLPTVVCYKTSYINWIIFKFLGKTDFISIVNLIAEKKILPELIQGEMTPINLLNNIIPYLNASSQKRKNTIESYKELKLKLGPAGIFDRAAKRILFGPENEK